MRSGVRRTSLRLCLLGLGASLALCSPRSTGGSSSRTFGYLPRSVFSTATIIGTAAAANTATISALGAVTSAPGDAPIPTNADMFISAINGVATAGAPDQAFIAPGDCVSLTMRVKFRVGEFVDVTQDARTVFFTDPPRGTITRNVFCTTTAEADKIFTVYGHFGPSGQQSIQDTVIIHVSRAAAPNLSLSLGPSGLSFGNQPVASTSAVQTLTVTNTGDGLVTISGVTLTGAHAASFVITGGGEIGSLGPGSSRTISVRFSPSFEGSHNASLVITSNAPGSPVSVPLTGAAIASSARISGEVRWDENGNSLPDPTDPPLPGVTLELLKATSREPVDLTRTGTSGRFSFEVPKADVYLVVPQDLPGYTRTAAIAGDSEASTVLNANEIKVTLSQGQSATGMVFLYSASIQPRRLVEVGTPVAATGRVALFGADPPAPDRAVTAVRSVADDGSLFVLDYAGTALLRLPPLAGGAAEIVIDTTRRQLPDGVGLARLLRVEISPSGTIVLVVLRADNTRGIYRLERGALTLLALLPATGGPVQLALGGAGQIAYVAPVPPVRGSGSFGPLALYQAAGGPGVERLRQGTSVVNGRPIGAFSDLTSNAAGDLAFLVSDADGTPRAVLRQRGVLLETVAATGQIVELGRGAGRTGVLTALGRPRIGPDGTVVFLGAGEGFVNFFVSRPGRPLEPMLVGPDWNPDPATFDYHLAGDGAAVLRAQRRGSSDSTLYLVAPTGGVSLVVTGRRDIQPIGQPVFGQAGRVFFLAQNLDLPPDRSGRPQIGLYRSRLIDGQRVLEGVAVPGQTVPGRPGARLLSITQRPIVSLKTVVFGILFGGSESFPVPTAALYRVPLDGTLAEGELIAPEGHEQSDAGRLAMIRELTYRGDGSLVFSSQLPGGGPVIVPATTPASIAGAFRTQALQQTAAVVPLVATGDNLGPGQLETALPPLLSLGPDRELFVARFSPSPAEPPGPNREGLFTIRRSKLTSEPVALTPGPALAGALFNGFADTRILSLSPPSVSTDAGAVNVVFKALLARGATSPVGLFQWSGSGQPSAVALSDLPLVPGDPLPYSLERWAAGKGKLVYLLARTAAGRARLFTGAGGPLKPWVEPGVSPIMGGDLLTDLFDFALNGGGDVFVAGATARGPGIFLAQGQLVPVAIQGGQVPPLPDGRGKGFVFGSRFQLTPGSGRGDLIFRASLVKPGVQESPRGEFRYRQGRLETRTIEHVGVEGARDVPIETIGDVFPIQNATGTSVAATFTQKEGWMIVRSQANRQGTGVTTEVIAQERQGTRRDVRRFVTLDAGPLLDQEGLPSRRGPVFAVNDVGDVAFLASDGKNWGIYQVPGPRALVGP